jgi:hypothetical protein
MKELFSLSFFIFFTTFFIVALVGLSCRIFEMMFLEPDFFDETVQDEEEWRRRRRWLPDEGHARYQKRDGVNVL